MTRGFEAPRHADVRQLEQHLQLVDARVSRVSLLPPAVDRAWIVSDTHIHPSSWFNIDDDVPALIKVLDSIPARDYVIILGDLTESMLASDKFFRSLLSSPFRSPDKNMLNFSRALFASKKSRAVLNRLHARPNSIVVLGNHDTNSAPALETYLGTRRVRRGPILFHGLLLLHGHELGWLFHGYPAEVVRRVLPWLNVTDRFLRTVLGVSGDGLTSRVDTRIDELVEQLRVAAAQQFAVYGHTHARGISGRIVNTGCFLKHQKSLVRVMRNKIEVFDYVE